MTFHSMWAELLPVGRGSAPGGYRRFAWTPADADCRAWFREQAEARGLAYEVDRNGNQWAWLGDPAAGDAVVTGSHLDSVPDGGAFDGPLGVVSSFAALDELRDRGARFDKPLALVNFGDEEGARFGLACVGSRLTAGQLTVEQAHRLTDGEGITLPRAMEAAGYDPRGHRARPRAAGPDRRLRGAARRTGPRAGPVRRPRGRRQRHLAARTVAVRLPRRGQPRGHHPAGRPP
ncbi:hypothetical protein GCM10017687_36430 [Streptomyces echinatus]